MLGTGALSGFGSQAHAGGRAVGRVQPAPLPAGYVEMARRYGVPPLILYGIALQESAMLFGARSLPWPWTLNVQGRPERFRTYSAAVAAMRATLSSGIRNVDAGLMQVNWGFHSDRLGHPARALDPYPNIAVGAQILREQYAATGDWYRAIGRYHSPGDSGRAADYAAAVFRRMAQVPTQSARPRAVLDRQGAADG
jgi:soluble lytic murein transglycosylase-like protein